MDFQTILLGSLCLGGAIGYIAAGWKGSRSAAGIAKAVASTSFIVLAIANGAAATDYGRLVLSALAFSWIGDMLLLSRQSPFLIAGIAAFFLAHVAYSAAFAMNDLDPAVFGLSLAATGALALLILIWLWKYLKRHYKIAVAVYLAAILVMVSLAIAANNLLVAVAAIAFAASDLSVARDRFIERSVINKAWGLPLYYLAQLLFAVSAAKI